MAQSSKEKWERYMNLLDENFTNLEGWVKERAYFNIEGLTKSLGEDLSNHDKLWAAMEQLQLVETDCLTYETRI